MRTKLHDMSSKRQRRARVQGALPLLLCKSFLGDNLICLLVVRLIIVLQVG